MVPGLWSLFRGNLEFPEHWFTFQICFAVAVAAFGFNLIFECSYLSTHLIDLEKKPISGPSANLFLGNMRFIQRCFKTHQLAKALAKVVEPFGTVYGIRWPLSTWIVLNDRESVQAIQVVAISERRVELKNRYGLVGGVWGFPWAKSTQMDGPWLASAVAKFAKRAQGVVAVAEKVTAMRCNHLLEYFSNPRGSSRVDIAIVVQRCVLDAVCETALGVDLGEAFQDDLLMLLDECRMRADDLFWFQRFHPQRIMQSAGILSRVQQRVRARIARIRNVPEVILREASDLLSIMLVAAEEDVTAGTVDEQIVAELLLYIISAYDTIWTSVAWVLYELARNPDALAAVRGHITAEDPHHSEPLLRVVVESLRLHPIMGHETYEGRRIAQVKDFYLPENVTYVCNVTALASDEQAYPDASQFDAQRYIDKHRLEDAMNEPWMPFAIACVSPFTRVSGITLVCSMVTEFLRNYDVNGADDRQHVQETTCRPFRGLPMTLIPICSKE